MLSKPKNPKYYQGREVNEHKQAPIVPSPKLVDELLGLKKQTILIKQTVLLKKVMDMRTAKRRAEKKKRKLTEEVK